MMVEYKDTSCSEDETECVWQLQGNIDMELATSTPDAPLGEWTMIPPLRPTLHSPPIPSSRLTSSSKSMNNVIWDHRSTEGSVPMENWRRTDREEGVCPMRRAENLAQLEAKREKNMNEKLTRQLKSMKIFYHFHHFL
ncbi:unnamed protein product [Caenorhabditis nigoni]